MSIFLLIVFVLIDAAVGILIVFALKKGKNTKIRMNRESREYDERRAYALPCNAVVADARGGIPGGSAAKARMTLTLDVTPPDGNPFRARTVWLVDLDALGNLQQGNEVSVKIDADNRKIIYPNNTWAGYVPD